MENTLQSLVLRYLKENGMTITYLAKSIDTSYSYVNCWLHGKRKIGKNKIEKIHGFLKDDHYKTPIDILKGVKEND